MFNYFSKAVSKNQILNDCEKKVSQKNKKNKGVAMQVMVIDIDKFAHEEVIAFCNVCENLAKHHRKTCDGNLCKFCIIDYYKNTVFTKEEFGYSLLTQFKINILALFHLIGCFFLAVITY